MVNKNFRQISFTSAPYDPTGSSKGWIVICTPLAYNLRSPMDPETNTVVHCLRTFLSSAEGDPLQGALMQTVEWQGIEAKAASHGVAPVVSKVLLQYANDRVPEEVQRHSKEQLTLLAQKNLLWLQEWKRLLRSFDEAFIPVISFKGPALALTAYRNLGLREFHDLDFLVDCGNVTRARDTLLLEGYELWSPVVGDSAESLLLSKNRQLRFTNRARGTCVDLHWGLVHEMFSFQFDAEQAFSSARMERHEEAEFLSLSPEYLLLYLCAHGTKNCWSTLSELCDVAAHIRSQCDSDWKGCFRLAEASGCELLLNHTLLLCERVLRIDLPEIAKRHCCEDSSAIALSNDAERFLCLKGGMRPDYMQTLKYYLAFAKTWRERIRVIFVRVFSPAEPDWKHVRIPRRFFGFYYVIRPLRFLQEQGSKFMGSS